MEMKTLMISVLAISWLCAARAITVTAYTDAPTGSPGSGCTIPAAALVASAGFINPVECALNACCFYQNFTFQGQSNVITSYFKATACTPGPTGQHTFNSGFTDAACTTGGSVSTGTSGACMSVSGPMWTGIGALRVTCTPPVTPLKPNSNSSASLASLAVVSLAAATLAACL
jgi:hypothetical protein